MNPEIKRYLDEHGATYTPEALRKSLAEAGYGADAVDAAMREWEAARSGASRNTEDRRTFGRWAVLLHLAALVATFVLLVLLKGVESIGLALLGAGVLAIALLIGWAISSGIGRALLPRAGVIGALIVPAISALLLGGACFGLMNAAITTPPRAGTVHLEIRTPLAFEGSGEADCYLNGGVQVGSFDLGLVDGSRVTASVNWYGDSSAPSPAGEADVTIYLEATSGTQALRMYSTLPTTDLAVDASPDGRSGTVEFEGLAREAEGPDDTDLELAGSASWSCE
jgi:hypothetical protein